MNLLIVPLIGVLWLVAFLFGIVHYHTLEAPTGAFLRRIVRWPIASIIWAYAGVGIIVGVFAGCFAFWTPFMMADTQRDPELANVVSFIWTVFITGAGIVVMFLWGDIREERRDRGGGVLERYPSSSERAAVYADSRHTWR
jgi:hypothetical protein